MKINLFLRSLLLLVSFSLLSSDDGNNKKNEHVFIKPEAEFDYLVEITNKTDKLNSTIFIWTDSELRDSAETITQLLVPNLDKLNNLSTSESLQQITDGVNKYLLATESGQRIEFFYANENDTNRHIHMRLKYSDDNSTTRTFENYDINKVENEKINRNDFDKVRSVETSQSKTKIRNWSCGKNLKINTKPIHTKDVITFNNLYGDSNIFFDIRPHKGKTHYQLTSSIIENYVGVKNKFGGVDFYKIDDPRSAQIVLDIVNNCSEDKFFELSEGFRRTDAWRERAKQIDEKNRPSFFSNMLNKHFIGVYPILYEKEYSVLVENKIHQIIESKNQEEIYKLISVIRIEHIVKFYDQLMGYLTIYNRDFLEKRIIEMYNANSGFTSWLYEKPKGFDALAKIKQNIDDRNTELQRIKSWYDRIRVKNYKFSTPDVNEILLLYKALRDNKDCRTEINLLDPNIEIFIGTKSAEIIGVDLFQKVQYLKTKNVPDQMRESILEEYYKIWTSADAHMQRILEKNNAVHDAYKYIVDQYELLQKQRAEKIIIPQFI